MEKVKATSWSKFSSFRTASAYPMVLQERVPFGFRQLVLSTPEDCEIGIRTQVVG